LALFAGALTSIAQTVSATVDVDDSPASWKAMRVFLYSAIMLNFSGAFLSLMIVKMCSDLPLAMFQNDAPPCFKRSVSDQLGHFGMSRQYWIVNSSFVVVSILASLCTFATLSFWVFLSQTFTVALITIMIFSLLALTIILTFGIAMQGQGWY
jgi:hypothetical protein